MTGRRAARRRDREKNEREGEREAKRRARWRASKRITSTFLFERKRSLLAGPANRIATEHTEKLRSSSYITTSTAMSEIRDATLSQIARGSDDTCATSLVFVVQGRVVSVQRIGGQWQPEVFAAGMSSSNTPCMVANECTKAAILIF